MIKRIDLEPTPDAAFPLLDEVKSLLLSREAMNLAEVVSVLEVDGRLVHRHLEHLVEQDCVEYMDPVVAPRTDDEPASARYFRWRRRTDGDFVWQKELILRQQQSAETVAAAATRASRRLPRPAEGIGLRVLYRFLTPS
jgi:predicted ArsR family transcriptional regulator